MLKHGKLKKLNILMVEIVNKNLGDEVIADTASFLFSKSVPKRFGKYNLFRYNIFSEDYDAVANSDMIIFAGGGVIKFKSEKYYYYVSKILETAQNHSIPVYINGIGVEDYDENDERCQGLKRALNYSCVKMISVRDDLKTLKNKYIKSDSAVKICSIIDPAVFSNKVYNVKKDRKSNVIGLGIIRGNIFIEHGKDNITPEYQMHMWAEIINKITDLGYDWQIFTNGSDDDYQFAEELMSYMGMTKSEEHFAVKPICSKQLVDIIAGYKAVIAGRMHANIIAYSLGIPSLGLVWNNKMLYWGKKSHHKDRSITAEDMTADKIISILLTAIREGANPLKNRYYKKSKKLMSEFLKEYCPDHSKAKELDQKLNSHSLVAVALGGENMRYSKLNTLTNIGYLYENGVRNFEADIRVSSDNELICINGFKQDVMEKLGQDPEKAENITYEEFMSSKWLNWYPTTDIKTLTKNVLKQVGVHLLLDIGKPNSEGAQKICDALVKYFVHNQHLIYQVSIQVQDRSTARIFMNSSVDWELIYYTEEKDREKQKQIAEYCFNNGIQAVSVPERVFDAGFADIMHEKDLKVYAFHYETISEIKKCFNDGADFVGTYYYDQTKLENLA